MLQLILVDGGTLRKCKKVTYAGNVGLVVDAVDAVDAVE